MHGQYWTLSSLSSTYLVKCIVVNLIKNKCCSLFIVPKLHRWAQTYLAKSSQSKLLSAVRLWFTMNNVCLFIVKILSDPYLHQKNSGNFIYSIPSLFICFSGSFLCLFVTTRLYARGRCTWSAAHVIFAPIYHMVH